MFARLAPAVVAAAVVGGAAIAFPLPDRAAPKDVAAIAREFAVPPLAPHKGDFIPLERIPYPAAALRGYRADVGLDVIRDPENAGRYRLRLAVLDAFGTFRDLWGKDWLVLRREFAGPVSDEVKRQIAEEQLIPARAIIKLETTIDRLEDVEGLRAAEPKRWQAHHDFALALCLARLAYLHEYNLMLGQIRTESLPDLDAAKGEENYRLVAARELTSMLAVRKLAKRAAGLFDKIVTEHPQTPWAAAAARERATPLGLRWEGEKRKAKE